MSGIMSMLLGAVSSVAVAVDEFFNRVTLLLPGNGTNGAQNNTFLDSSSNNFTITRNGNTTQGTFSPFSQTGWSNYFLNTGSQNLSAVTGADTSPGTGDFCAELWYWSTTTSGNYGLFGNLESNTDTQWGILLIQGSSLVRFQGWNTTFVSGTEPARNAWNHVAVCRSGTTMSMFINGTRAGTATVSNNFSATTNIRVGGPNGVDYFLGYISNARFVKGSSVYGPSQTSITVPTSPLTAITNTKFLTCQNNRFVDNSSTGYAITPNGTPSVQAFSPFAPTAAYSAATVGGSGYFDGTGDYLSNSSLSPSWSPGSSDFCIEGWGYWTSFDFGLYGAPIISFGAASGQLMIRANKTSGSTTSANYYSVSNGVFIPSAGFSSGVSGGTLYLNTWNHVALTRSGSTFRLFVNGALVNTQTDATAYGSAYNTVVIGADTSPSNGLTAGYITGVRVVAGNAVYTAAFTPPTAPITAISGTYILTNFTNAGITDATAKNVLETAGNAQISTTQSKFGGSSMYFDGTGDYLTSNAATTDLYAFGSGDFTIEMWIRFDVVNAIQCFYDNRPAASQGAYSLLYLNSDATIRYFVSSADRITSSAVLANTWYHVALSRSGTSTRMFINGTQAGSTYTDSTVYLNATSRPWIGINSSSTNTQALSGYIDDLRVTKGFARYTANFTAPTAAFPTQ